MVAEAQQAPTPMPIKGLAVGRIVHWVSDWSGEHFAAIITQVYEPAPLIPQDNPPVGVVSLAVHDPYARHTRYVDAVGHDPTEKAKGTWHFPEYVP